MNANEVQDLVNQLHEVDPLSRKDIVHALKKIKQDQSVPLLVDAFKQTDNYLYKQRLIYVLGEIGSPEAFPYVIEALKDPHFDVEDIAAWALGKLGRAEAIPYLLETAQVDHSEVTETALYAIANLIDDEHQIEVADISLHTDNSSYEVRRAATKVLEKIKNIDSVNLLIKLLFDETYEVSIAAVLSLSEIGEFAVEPLLQEAVDADKYQLVWLTRALRFTGSMQEAFLDFLLRVISHEDKRVKIEVIHALFNFRDRPEVNNLLKEYLNNIDPDITEAAKQAIGRDF